MILLFSSHVYRFIFQEIILPLARAWRISSIRKAISDHLFVLKPTVRVVQVHVPRLGRAQYTHSSTQVFPALFDWVSFPIVLMMKSLYAKEIENEENGAIKPCHMRVELLAALERLLCFCHTGNTAVLATSLINPLGLSKGVLKDGFPVLLRTFQQPRIRCAMNSGFMIDPRRWPKKDGYPAIASKKAQVLTYSMNHFLVSPTMFTLYLSAITEISPRITTCGMRGETQYSLRRVCVVRAVTVARSTAATCRHA